jgi:aminoglycoside phosphotransferase (APT) family kinase protein
LTYLVKIAGIEYVLRRPPFGNQVKSAHDMRANSMFCRSSQKFISPRRSLSFTACRRIRYRLGFLFDGTAQRFDYSRKIAGDIGKFPELQKSVCESFIANLAELHALDYEKIGLGELGKPEGYARRQVEGWTKRYFNAKTDEHAELEIQSNGSKKRSRSLRRGARSQRLQIRQRDAQPENLTEIVAVLDWEMATVGEPLMDLGTTLGYWMSKESGAELLNMPFNPRVLMENISRRELVEIYAEKSGRDTFQTYFFITFSARSKSRHRAADLLPFRQRIYQRRALCKFQSFRQRARQNRFVCD